MKTIGRKLPSDDGAPFGAPSDPGAMPSRMVKAMPAEDQPLKLPKGAFVILRKSGGLRFTSTETAVFRDGRVTREAVGAAETPQELTASPRLSRRQVRELRTALTGSGLPALSAQPSGRHNPDGYAYEIVARVGRKVYAAEVFDGSMPASIQPVIAALSGIGAARDPG